MLSVQCTHSKLFTECLLGDKHCSGCWDTACTCAEAEVGMGSGVRQTCVQMLSPPSSSCVTLGILVNLSVSVSSSMRQGKEQYQSQRVVGKAK